MKQRSTGTRLGIAVLMSVTFAGAAVLARGAQGGGGPQAIAGAQPVGTLQIESLAGAPATIYGFGFDMTNVTATSGGGGSGVGKATLTDVQVTRLPDALSPLLFRAGVLGTHLPTARIVVVTAGKTTPSASYLLSDVLLSGFSAADGIERISLKFRTIQIQVGDAQFCFDQSTNAAC